MAKIEHIYINILNVLKKALKIIYIIKECHEYDKNFGKCWKTIYEGETCDICKDGYFHNRNDK